MKRVAWVYYSKAEYSKALPYAKAALTTNCKNPVLLCRMGLVYFKNGDKTTAAALLKSALQANPNINTELRKQTEAAVATL